VPPPFHDGADLTLSGAGHGATGPGGATAALLALIVFIAPGFAHWLWAGTGSRPRALGPRRPDRPG